MEDVHSFIMNSVHTHTHTHANHNNPCNELNIAMFPILSYKRIIEYDGCIVTNLLFRATRDNGRHQGHQLFISIILS
jgi:hypothetical protein